MSYIMAAVPLIIQMSDYDEFKSLVQQWVQTLADRGHQFKCKTIWITAGPYRMYDVSWDVRDEGILKLDFYSVARHRHIPYPEELTNCI